MTKMERMKRVLAGEPVDRPPVCFWRHYGNIGAQATIDAHMRFFRETDMDVLKMMCDEFFTYPIGDAKTIEDFKALRPQGRKSPFVGGQIERATQINEALKGEVMTFYNAFSPYSKLKHTIGDEQSMYLLREHEDVALHLLEVICEDTCMMVEGMLTESGTTGMMLPVQGAEDGRFTAEEYARLIAPTERRVIECAEKFSNANMLHMCGWDGKPNNLDWWDKYPARLLSWAAYVENLDPAQAHERFPDRILVGGFDNREGTLLHVGTKEEIQAETRRLVKLAGKDGLILGADCSLPSDVDTQHLRWIVEALDEMAE